MKQSRSYQGGLLKNLYIKIRANQKFGNNTHKCGYCKINDKSLRYFSERKGHKKFIK